MLRKHTRLFSIILTLILAFTMTASLAVTASAGEPCKFCGSTTGRACIECGEYCNECEAMCPRCNTCVECAERYNVMYCENCGGCGMCYEVCPNGDGCSNCTRLYQNGCANCVHEIVNCPACGEETENMCSSCANRCDKCSTICHKCGLCAECMEYAGFKSCSNCGGCPSCYTVCVNKDGCSYCADLFGSTGCSNCTPDACPNCYADNCRKCAECGMVCSECALICEECGICEDCSSNMGVETCAKCGGCENCFELSKHKTTCSNCFTGNPFSDATAGAWYYDDVMYVAANGLMTGYSNSTKFGPSDVMNRAMFATVLYRMENCPGIDVIRIFPDVAAGEYYDLPVVWASVKNAGIITGYSNGLFGPSDPITREQMATMMYRYACYKGYVDKEAEISTEKLCSYPDSSKVSSWSETAMAWAVNEGIISGKAGKYLDPQGLATRSECAAILHRFDTHYDALPV